jgi:hypothetical protein
MVLLQLGIVRLTPWKWMSNLYLWLLLRVAQECTWMALTWALSLIHPVPIKCSMLQIEMMTKNFPVSIQALREVRVVIYHII